MEIISNPERMRLWSRERHAKWERIAFIPTMGYLHEGHLSLMRWGRDVAERLVVSIFVNPTQFGPGEDYDKYPRDEERDLGQCREVGVDVVFMPAARAMYPVGYQTTVMVGELARPLCGASRPGHFDGVATVVAKLFNIVLPDVAIFGEKDYQQMLVIERMVRDLNLGAEVAGRPTVREPDGLAMSSRNRYLSGSERESASSLSQGLALAEEMYLKGERDTAAIAGAVRGLIESRPGTRIDYVELRDAKTLEEIERIEDRALLALAVFVGETRLIDNRVIGR